MPPTAYLDTQEAQPDQLGYRLPPQLQSTSLLLQLLPAGSAQSLTELMSRAASGASVEYDPQEQVAIGRSSSLSNDNTTSVSVGSPKRSLLDMSRAVSEQLHLTSAGKGVQRPFLADLQQRWTAGHQVGFCWVACMCLSKSAFHSTLCFYVYLLFLAKHHVLLHSTAHIKALPS